MKLATILFAVVMLTATTLKAQNGIDDIEVDEDSGETVIADLDEVFGDLARNPNLSFNGAPRELNMSIDGNRVLRFTPDDDYNLPDGADITVTAVTADGNVASVEFNLVVVPVNDAPVVENPIDDIEVEEDAERTWIADLDNVFMDIDDDELNYSFRGAPDEVNMEIDDDNILSVQPERDFIDFDGIEITVVGEDPDGESAEDVFILIIGNENPEFPGIGDIIVDEDPGRIEIANLAEVFADWEGDELFFSLEGSPDELNMVIEEDLLLTFEPEDNFNLPDGVNITLIAEEGEGRTIEITFNLTIRPVNDEPVVSSEIEDLEVDEDSGETIIADLDDVFSDIEDEQLSFEFAGAPEELNMQIDEENQLLFNPAQYYNLPEGVEITVTATDIDSAFVEDVFRLIVTPVDEPLPNITYYLFFGTYIPGIGQGPVIQITPLGENVAVGDAFVIPDYNLEDYNLGDSFQIYMDAMSGTTVEIEAGGIEEDIEVHLILGNLIVTGGQGGEPFELAGIWSPDDDLQEQLWMFADFQVWTVGEDSVQVNAEEDFEFNDDNRMVVNIPLNDEFRGMMENMGLDYDSLGAGMWLPDEEDWDLNGIVSAEIEIGEESWFRIELSHLSIVGGGPNGGFDELGVPIKEAIPTEYFLSNAYPNPFNSVTNIDFGLQITGEVSINVYDLSGRNVATLINSTVTSGMHSVVWDAVDITAGVYILQMKAGGFTTVQKLAYIK